MQKTDILVNALIINRVHTPLTIEAPYSCTLDVTDELQSVPAGMWFSSTTDGQEIGTITCGSEAPGTCKILGGGSTKGVAQTRKVSPEAACDISCDVNPLTGASLLGQISCTW